jgi:glycosyltransferase involved in cell wall biosynthesis/SAM-dependent methyltransferase
MHKIIRRLIEAHELNIIRRSGLFDKNWYLRNNHDVVQANIDPALHYLYYGGIEGRDPGPNFSGQWYLETYEDVKNAKLNPLVHYLNYGKKEGRVIQPKNNGIPNHLYQCSVCGESINEFLPLSVFYLENMKKYGYPYTTADAETINEEQYACPHCGATDRDRLFACYLERRLPRSDDENQVMLLDIAPSVPLSSLIKKFKKVTHHTADLQIKNVDFTVDISNMPEVVSNSYDVLICSHVLEHVNDDKKALSELFRVLKPGGWGLILVPIILTIDQIDEDPQVTDVAERWRRFGQYDHVRLYSKTGFIKRVEGAGFRLRQLGIDYFGEVDFRQYGITKKSVLYIAEKPNKEFHRQKDEKRNSNALNDDLPLLTVIIFTYNQEDCISQAVESVLEQETTYPFEIWLCDDCSTDNTAIICDDYAKRHPDIIKLFAQPANTTSDPNKIPHNEIAIKKVKTKYFCVLDGDDYWCDKNKIQIALDVLENDPEYVTFAHDTAYNDTVNKTKKSLVHEIHRVEIQNPVIFENAPYLHTSSRIHRNVIKFTENRNVNGDIFLLYMYLDKGPLYYYDKIMSVYNISGKGVWSGLSDSAKKKALAISQYKLNEYFDYRYDIFFTRRVEKVKVLDFLKRILGKKLGWKFWCLLFYGQ